MVAITAAGLRREHPDGTAALDGVDLAVADGELVALLGPSGSGKSTLVRVLAGVDAPTAGWIRFDGRDVTALSPRERDVALLAQSRTIPPHRTVAEHLAAPLQHRRLPDDEVARRTTAERRALGLDRIWRRRARQLSAGDAQRAALASAVVRLPAAWLLDEPLQMLDPPGQAELRTELLRLQRAGGATTIWATNDHASVLGVADRVVVLRQGRVAADDHPARLLGAPPDRFVAGFVGDPPMGFLDAVVVTHPLGGADLGGLDVGGHVLRVPGGLPGPLRERIGAPVVLGARPDAVRGTEPGDPTDRRLPGVARRAERLGREDRVVVELPGGVLTARFPPGCGVGHGDRVEVTLDVRALAVFTPDGQALRTG